MDTDKTRCLLAVLDGLKARSDGLVAIARDETRSTEDRQATLVALDAVTDQLRAVRRELQTASQPHRRPGA